MAISLCGRRIILTRTGFFKIPKRNGYIILVPEIGDDLTGKNPLLKKDGFPEFNQVTVEKCIAAVAGQSAEYEEGVNRIQEQIRKNERVDFFEDIVKPLEELGTSLETTWGVAQISYFGNHSLMPTKYYISILQRIGNVRSLKFNSQPIYKACTDALNDVKQNWTEEERRVLYKFELEGRLNGLALEENTLPQFQHSQTKAAKLRMMFKQKLQSSTNLFTHTITDPNIMKDFPEDYLKTVAKNPMQSHEGPWTITLQPHILIPFLEYCPDRTLRWNAWHANVIRSTVHSDESVRTSVLVELIRRERKYQANFLGFTDYASMSMETKMAGSLQNVYKTFDTLLNTARPVQEQEIDELTKFASDRGFNSTLRQWDIEYWGRKQRQSVYKCNEEVLKEYFPLPKVLTTLFQLAERLFDISIVEQRKVDVWHKDVQFFDILDLKKSNAEPVASFYLDPYSRRNDKSQTAGDSQWMLEIRSKNTYNNTTPLAALIFNFQPPIEGKPSLLTFNNVLRLFQNFGQALQHLLTTVNYSEVAGTINVEWDAVNISGYFMEHWLYEPSTLTQITGHYETEKPLPMETIEGLKQIRSHLAGYYLCKELYLSRLDLELHSTTEFWLKTMKHLWPLHFAIPLDKKNLHVCSFESIFSDVWAAAYYCRLWSRMVAADVYSAFKEIPADDKDQEKVIGKRFRDTFLSLGGSCHPSEIFRRFRGRDPNPKALLKTLNLKSINSKVIEQHEEIKE